MLRTSKANLLDNVELVEDLPEYGVKRGEQGVVVEVFDEPDKGYILEFGDPSGTSSRLAYWVKPDQIKRVTPRKAQELEIVELAEDLAEYGVKKGERAVVTTAFSEPDEAYDLEFVDDSGTASRFAYSVKPNQIRTEEEVSKEAFERGLALINEGKPSEAEREFQRAIDLRPALIVNLHNLMLNMFQGTNKWEDFIVALRLVLRLNPDFEIDGYNMSIIAGNNLAMAYQNYAVQKANEGDMQTAITYFDFAMGVRSGPETLALIRRNLAKAYTLLGIEAAKTEGAQTEDYAASVARLSHACEVDPNDMTRHNFGFACARLAQHYLDLRDYKNALSTFEHAIDLGLVFPELLNDYGIALAMAGDQDDAVLAFQRARKLAPNNDVIQRNLRLVEGGVNVGFNTIEINVKFDDPPKFDEQPMEYYNAA
jgi:tetratricopeptide (TPR) repeat protein